MSTVKPACGIDPNKPFIEFSKDEFNCLKQAVIGLLKKELKGRFNKMTESELRSYCIAHESEFGKKLGVTTSHVALTCEWIIQEKKAAGTLAEDGAAGQHKPMPAKFKPSDQVSGTARFKK